MIARIWFGRTDANDVEPYTRYVRDTGVTAQRATPGNLESLLLTRVDGRFAHFIVLSLWESEEAIRAFSGPEIDRAVYFPEDERYLLELPERLQHYRVAAHEAGPVASPAGDTASGAAIEPEGAPA